MQPVKVGVVGVGHMGKHHVKTYAKMGNVKLTGVVDIDEDRVKEVANDYEAKWHLNHHDLIDKVDAVSIAVPTSVHYEVAKDFLQAGVHVLLEKPMTTTMEEAQKLIDIAGRKKVLLQIGHVERFNASVQELKHIVRDPFYIDANRLGPHTPRVRDVGVVMDLMVHDIDIILNLVDSRIKEIDATGVAIRSEHEDVANIQMLFENGCIANLTASRVAESRQRTLAITQEGAHIFLDYVEQDISIKREPTPSGETRSGAETILERPFVQKVDPLQMEIKHFLECARGRSKPLVSMENELRSLEVAIEVISRINGNGSKTSARTGLPAFNLGLRESIRSSAR